MAMYVETMGRDGRHPDATTLEEAAEELLNGLLCHYEPPDPRSVKKMQQNISGGAQTKGGRRGILRASTKMFRNRKSKRRGSKSVRWKDEQNKSKTPAIYDIGKGCQEALSECGSTDADYLERETEKLAELSQQRTPKPISKRIKNPNPDDLESSDEADRYSTTAVAKTSQTAASSKYKAESDPISSYRSATESPKTASSEMDDALDDDNSLFDDQGNAVGKEGTSSTPATKSNYGPPLSPAPHQSKPQREERKPRQQTPYKHQPQESSMRGGDSSTLCGLVCGDPKFLNCDVTDEDYLGNNYNGYPPPPPPPPPLPERSNHYYQYDDLPSSGVSASETEEEEDEIVSTPSKRGFRDRFRRKSRRSSDPSAKGRGRSRSPGRRGRSPGRSKSPGRRGKYPRSPLSFITGNRSFSTSPRAKAGRDAALLTSDSEANLSVQSSGSSIVNKRKTSKSPLRRKWFGRGRKSSREGALTPTNSDWDYLDRPAPMGYGNDGGMYPSRGRSMERQDELPMSRSRSYDRMDYIDRSRMSDFDVQGQMLRSTRSRSLDRQDQRGRQRHPSYDRPESHIGLSRMSFDEEELRQARSRSLEPSDQLLPSRSRSLERQDFTLSTSRSRSLDRQDQRSLFSSNDARQGVGYEQPEYEPRLNRTSSHRSTEKEDPYLRGRGPGYDRPMDPRRSSYPFPQPPQRGYANGGGRQPAPAPQQQPPHWQQPTPRGQEDYQQYHSFAAQRTSSYPPQASQGPFDPTPRGQFDYAEPTSNNISWWGGRRSMSMEQPHSAAEPPAALYSHQPRQQIRPMQMQPNSIYSHDPQFARAPAVMGRDMPPTPTQRQGAHPHFGGRQQQYVDAPQLPYVDQRQMPPTPTQRAIVYPPNNRPAFDQYSQQQQQMQEQPQQKKQEPRRDPTPRNRLLDLVRSPLQNSQQQAQPPAQPFQRVEPRPFNVAEEIHRVSWGEAPRRDNVAENPIQNKASSEPEIIINNNNNNNNSFEQAKPMVTSAGRQGIPSTLPGRERQPPPPPPPPPPPQHQPKRTAQRPKQTMPQNAPQNDNNQNAPQNMKPPLPTTQENERPQQINKNEAATNPEQQMQLNDAVDENRPILPPMPKKDGKSRKILGLFGRNKKKSRPPNRYPADDMDNDASIISDAILRDRHDRFVTKL